LQANDVVFTQVAAGLHFNDLQWDAARVAQLVHGAQGNTSALIFGEYGHLITFGGR